MWFLIFSTLIWSFVNFLIVFGWKFSTCDLRFTICDSSFRRLAHVIWVLTHVLLGLAHVILVLAHVILGLAHVIWVLAHVIWNLAHVILVLAHVILGLDNIMSFFLSSGSSSSSKKLGSFKLFIDSISSSARALHIELEPAREPFRAFYLFVFLFFKYIYY